MNKKKTLVPKLRFPEFKEDWNKDKLGNLITIKSGFSPSSYILNEYGNFPFIKVEELNNCVKYQNLSRFYSNEDKNLIEKHSVIFPKRGAAILNNKVRINDCPILMDSNMMSITPYRDKLNHEFLFYKIVKEELYKIADTSTIPQINNKHIEPYIVFIPSLPEQQKIASFLSAVDEKIQQLTRKKELLEQYKKGVMQQLFSGKLRFSGKNDEWDKVIFTDCCDLIHGFQFRDEHFEITGLPVVKIGNLLNNGGISLINATYVAKEFEKSHKKFILKKGDILMALTGGTLGKVSRVDKDYGIIFQNYRVGKFESKENSLNKYIYYLLQSNLVQNRVKSLVNEAAQPNFGKQDFDKIRFKLPPLKEQQKIAAFLSSIDVKIENVNQQLNKAQQFKKGLLQQMFV